MGNATPTARGTLRATPIAQLLAYSLDKRLTGTLVVEEPNGARSALLFEAGQPAKAKCTEPVCPLGDLLIELGQLSAEDRERMEPVAQQRTMHYGELLVAHGVIDRNTLRTALEEQLARRVVWLFSRPADSIFGYYDGQNYLERWGRESTPISGLMLLARGLRTHEDPARRDEMLAKLGDRVLRLHLDSKVMRFQLQPAERAVTDLVRVKPQPLSSLIASQIADEATVRRVIHLLALTRHLDVGARPIGVEASGPSLTPPGVAPVSSHRPPSFSTFPANRASSVPSSGAPPGTPPHGLPLITTPPPSMRSVVPSSSPEADLEAWRAEIVARAERASQQNHYELLGVAPHARASEIQVAFLQLAKKWHPDRLSPALSDLKDTVTRTFARMNEAVQVLSDELQRRQYDAKLSGGGALSADEEHVQRVLLAATAFQKAQALLRTNNLAAAELEAKRAVEDDPSQGEYLALYTWILAQAPSPDLEMVDKLLVQLGRAAQHEPNNERILFYRGLTHKRLGKDDHAYRDFKAVLEINPHNIEAAREVRFYRMRHPARSGPPPAVKDDKGSHKPLLNKLFKR